MKTVRTPCIGICSTTSLGDDICRGCKRFNFEVIRWNSYTEEQKKAVLRRIDQLTTQIMSERFQIIDVNRLQMALDDFRFFYDPDVSPFCWLHNLLQKRMHRIGRLDEIGVRVAPSHGQKSLQDLVDEVNTELYRLSSAHHERYFEQGRRQGLTFD